ncbi:hypothetical protein ACLOJK_001846 [Asimina triloba]
MEMAGQLPITATGEETLCLGSSWYLPRKLIEDQSPSRTDGIDLKKETQLRNLYCSFLQDVGKKLKLTQITISVAAMICHRFYLRQSHARNEWQTIATASMFLASKVEETPRLLMDVVVVAYETMYRRDPISAQRIKNKDVSEKQKDLILTAERLVLSTINFDLNIQLPYKPLSAAFKKFKITSDLCKLAWNFVNDWYGSIFISIFLNLIRLDASCRLRTTICLQYKPHYIAAGSLFLAAKSCHVKLPSERGMVWWHEFDVTPRQLEEVIKQMQDFLEQKKAMTALPLGKVSQIPARAEKEAASSPESCIVDVSAVAATTSNCPVDNGPGQVNPSSSVICHDPGAQDCSNNNTFVIGDGDLHHDPGAQDCSNNNTFVIGDGDLRHDPGAQDCSNNNTCVIGDGDLHHDAGALDCSNNNVCVTGDGDLQCQASDCGSARSTIEDSERMDEGMDQVGIKANCGAAIDILSVNKGLSELDKDRIRSKLNRKRWERDTFGKVAEPIDDIVDDDAWIERELENGIVVGAEYGEKKQRQV